LGWQEPVKQTKTQKKPQPQYDNYEQPIDNQNDNFYVKNNTNYQNNNVNSYQEDPQVSGKVLAVLILGSWEQKESELGHLRPKRNQDFSEGEQRSRREE
jgi:hypothetical protein